MDLQPGQIWKHYKGHAYKILVQCRHTESLEELVVYQRLGDGNIYARPLNLFFDTVEWEGKKVPRFTLSSVSE